MGRELDGRTASFTARETGPARAADPAAFGIPRLLRLAQGFLLPRGTDAPYGLDRASAGMARTPCRDHRACAYAPAAAGTVPAGVQPDRHDGSIWFHRARTGLDRNPSTRARRRVARPEPAVHLYDGARRMVVCAKGR